MPAAFRWSVLALAFSALATGACSSDDTSGGAAPPGCVEGTPGCIGWTSCPPEFEPDPSGVYCREIVHAGECAPGSMPLLGSADCVPVGTPECAAGFEPDPSGWGCRAIVSATSCTGATRDAVGAASCVPVGDCNAPFPPPDATIFVNPAFTDAELGPTKHRTIVDAMTVASAGATIAVESGTYAEGIVVSRSNVSIVGRCPELVRLVGTGLDKHGVLVTGHTNVLVKGVTLFDHYEGARAMNGGTLRLEDVVIEEPRFVGLIAWQPNSAIRAERVVVRNVKPYPQQTVLVVSVNADEGGTVELVDSSLAGSYEAGALATNATTPGTPSTLRLTRTVIRDTNLTSSFTGGAALVISGTSKGEVKESAILDSRRIGALAVYEGSDLSIERSEIRKTLEDTSGIISAGVSAEESGKVTLDGVSVHDVVQSGLLARTGGSITARSSVVRGTMPGADRLFGMGAWADGGGKLILERTALVDNASYGVGLIDAPSAATLKDVLIRGTQSQKTQEGGLGRGVNVEDGAAVEIDGVSIVENDGEGLLVRGETADGERAHATAKRLLVDGARGFDGVGVFVARGGNAEIDGAAITRARRAGVIVSETTGDADSRAQATLTHVLVRDTTRATQIVGDGDDLILDGIGIGSAGDLTLRSSAVVGSIDFGIIVGSLEGLTTIESSHVGGTKPNDLGDLGYGIAALTDTLITIRQVDVAENAVGLLFHGASGVVSDSRIRANAVGIHTQSGSKLSTVARAPEAIEPGVVFVTEDSQFIENATRVGGGELPLPESPFADIQSTR